MIKARLASSLANVIGDSAERAMRLIENIKTGDLEFFEGYFNKLPGINFSTNANAESKNGIIYITGKSIGEGSYGSVFKNRNNPYVYKLVADKSKNKGDVQKKKRFLKGVFQELIIQTLLQSDEKYGDKICKIYKIYRKDDAFILKLQALECTLIDRLRLDRPNIVDKNKFSKFVVDLILNVNEMLDYLYEKYGFRHQDLHEENIMTVYKGDIISNMTIIDFGRSCVNFEDVKIGQFDKDIEHDVNQIIKDLYKFGSKQGTPVISNRLIEIMKPFHFDDMVVYDDDGLPKFFPDLKPLKTLLSELKNGPITNNVTGGRKTRGKRTRKA